MNLNLKKTIRISSFVTMTFYLGVICAETAVIRIQKQVTVKAGFVKLKDVATIQENDEKLRSRLEEIVLTPTPPSGRKTRLRFDTIRLRLNALGFDMTEIEFQGNSSVTVYGFGKNNPNIRLTAGQIRLKNARQRKTVQLAEENVQREVGNYLRRIAPELGIVKLELDLKPGDVTKILKSEIPGWDISGGAPPWDRPQLFRIRFLDEYEIVQTINISVKVSPQPAIVVARYDIPRGQILTRKDLELTQVANVKEGIVRIEQVLGRETVKTLRREKPIRPNDIKKVPLVRRGDIVTVISQFGGIRAERNMIASDEGGMGDVIVVTTTDRKEKVFATISGLRTAAISAAKKKHYDSQVRPAGGLKIQYVPTSAISRSSRRKTVSRRTPKSRPPGILHPYGARRVRK